jgi:ABC-type Mn2+/Zn2+ transport system permease subunit
MPASAPFITAIALSVACATLSVFVVSRRWAFIGEGISHSGFGGAGTAWLLALALPGTIFEEPWVPACGVVTFCLGTAFAIGYMTRARRISSDTAIGVFMVASLAWGFLARSLYRALRNGKEPMGFDALLFGDTRDVSAAFALTAVLLGAAIVGAVFLLRKEILYYCFDAAMAEASGVHARLVHYLLILLVSLTIVIGARVVGTVLVTALLVLPGATALNLCRGLGGALAASIVAALAGTVAGLAASRHWAFLPTGPAVVLCLFGLFVLSMFFSRIRPAV